MRLTIGQLAGYAGVTVRTVRHYHQIGLLPEPDRDESGYRRYGALAVVRLIKIRTLADAGVPLSRIDDLLRADVPEFTAAINRIDDHLSAEIARLKTSRKQIAGLAAGDHANLPPEVAAYFARLLEIGASERMVEAERDGWIIVAARWPERVREWMPYKFAALEDPRMVRLYRLLSVIFDHEEADDAMVEEIADIMADLAEEAEASGEVVTPDDMQDELPFDLLDALADEKDPRAHRMREAMRRRGWDGWTRMARVDQP